MRIFPEMWASTFVLIVEENPEHGVRQGLDDFASISIASSLFAILPVVRKRGRS